MTELEQVMKELAETMRDFVRSNKESSEDMRRSIAESDAKIAQSRRDTDAEIAESRREMARSIAESDAKIAESRRVTDAKIAESTAEIAAAVKRMDDLDGTVRNRFGNLTEKLLVPGIRALMQRCGHDFTRMAPNEEFYARKGVRLAEIDLFLENPTEAMAVEVKTHMSEDDVTKHMDRLRSLRAHEELVGVKGKTLYGAMAGLKIDRSARELALDRGLYVVEMVEDTKYVNVVEPPSGVRGW